MAHGKVWISRVERTTTLRRALRTRLTTVRGASMGRWRRLQTRIKCIDCEREYTPEELHNLGLIPQERRAELELNETEQSWLDRVLREEVSEVKAKKKHNKPSQKARVAGTDYQCAWCPEKILNVDAYISRFRRRRPDGQWQHDRLHAECDIASQEWFGEYPFDEFTPHMFRRGTCTEAI
jgi:hypothetical protein